MKFPPHKTISFPAWRMRPFQIQEQVQARLRQTGTGLLSFRDTIKQIGVSSTMEEYDKRKLGIFNQLNFLQLITGILVPMAGLFRKAQFPPAVWITACIPALTSVLVLWLNSRRRIQVALIAYFIIYPLATGIVYLSGINMGVELSFILYGILSVFFIQDLSQMLFALGLAMVNYFILAVVCKNFRYELSSASVAFYFFNQLLAIVFIFYGLYLIKKENHGYQQSILRQKEDIAAKSQLLHQQTEALTELNAVKNRLFSIVAHDLKAPIYALRTLFQNMQQYDLPAAEIKEMVPEVVNELTYTTSLMENLLQWARTQMQSDAVKPQLIDVSGLMTEVAKLLRLQAEAKRIRVELLVDQNVCAFADKDMINLVLRNLLSNAIKYTPVEGTITVGAGAAASGVEIFVSDTGQGITKDAMDKIALSNYYTTRGTAGESGTGLGLMLCREFLLRNGGTMQIESEPGRGSKFSFTLPVGE